MSDIRNLLIFCIVFYLGNALIEDHSYWKNLGDSDLEEALNKINNNGVAKNVILFIGDGMGPTTVTAARIYSKVPDSCSTATALFCGIKANQKTSGVDATVAHTDCEASLNKKAQLDSIIVWAQEVGKYTGFVTTTRVTHATPSALYAHTPDRKWECEATIPVESSKCKDIARQLIEDEPGRNINVIMGGGRQCFQSNVTGSSEDPIDTWSCFSNDGRDLIKDWMSDKEKRQKNFTFISNNEELENLDVNNNEFVLGVFANGHLKMEHERNRGPKGMPSLSNMTEKAILTLKNNPKGFVLMVEGGLIDFGHHRGHARKALDETVAFNEAIQKAIELTSSDDTLIIVTSDHSHSLVFSGYSDRNQSVLDVAQKSKIDGRNYTALLYGTGGPNNFQFLSENGEVIRNDPGKEDVLDFEYSQQAVVLTDEVTHSGTDVLVYAQGPMSHLFSNVHEQTYVAYVISYAAKIGPYKNRNSGNVFQQTLMLVIPLLFIVIYLL